MTGDAPATTFVTGAAGFIGTELIKVLVDRGHQVFGLAQCAQAAQRVRRAGALPVMGDLLEPGRWQDEVAADWYGATARVQSPRTSRLWRPDSWPVQSWPTTCWPTPCSRTFACAVWASASGTPRWTMDSGKF